MIIPKGPLMHDSNSSNVHQWHVRWERSQCALSYVHLKHLPVSQLWARCRRFHNMKTVSSKKWTNLLSSHNNECVDFQRVQLLLSPSCSVFQWVLTQKYVKSTVAAWKASFEIPENCTVEARLLSAAFWCIALWAHTERLFCGVREIRDMEVWMCDMEVGQRFPFRFVSDHLLGPPNGGPHGRSKHAINSLFCWGFI